MKGLLGLWVMYKSFFEYLSAKAGRTGKKRFAKTANTTTTYETDLRGNIDIYIFFSRIATGTRFSCENRVFCLQKRLKIGILPPLLPQGGMGQLLDQALDPNMT